MTQIDIRNVSLTQKVTKPQKKLIKNKKFFSKKILKNRELIFLEISKWIIAPCPS